VHVAALRPRGARLLLLPLHACFCVCYVRPRWVFISCSHVLLFLALDDVEPIPHFLPLVVQAYLDVKHVPPLVEKGPLVAVRNCH
jgi:hypothetical protein